MPLRFSIAKLDSLAEAAKFTILQFGGIDVVVNTAAIYPIPGADGELSDSMWAKTFLINRSFLEIEWPVHPGCRGAHDT